MFGFNDHWINLSMECITSTSFSILVNGKAHGYFYPSRSIRLGDPLFSYIFILCMKPMIRHLDKIGRSPKNNVGLLTTPKVFRVTNLNFADDCLIFAKATSTAARNVAKMLNDFSCVSSQKD